jgi:hypothetical protein
LALRFGFAAAFLVAAVEPVAVDCGELGAAAAGACADAALDEESPFAGSAARAGSAAGEASIERVGWWPRYACRAIWSALSACW